MKNMLTNNKPAQLFFVTPLENLIKRPNYKATMENPQIKIKAPSSSRTTVIERTTTPTTTHTLNTSQATTRVIHD